MKIIEAMHFFLNLKNDSVEESDIIIYDKYSGILSDLKNRDLTPNQIQSIEVELETLALDADSDNRKKYLTQKLTAFQNFLKDKFALVSEGYYTGIGAGIGIVIGSVFSMLLNSVLGAYALLIGINGGIIFGVLIGGTRDAEAKKQRQVLITKAN